jgi:hypothetical protein
MATRVFIRHLGKIREYGEFRACAMLRRAEVNRAYNFLEILFNKFRISVLR